MTGTMWERIRGSKKKPDSTLETSLVSHLVELRDRLIRVFMFIGVVFLCLFPFANDLYEYLAAPLLQRLSQGATTMIAIEVASPFLIPFKMTLLVAVLLTIPYILYQTWSFIAPGMYKKEQRLAMPLLISSTLLFYLGMGFAYYVAFPLMFGFFTSISPEGVKVMTDIGKYFDFVAKIFVAFGAAFEVPVATFLLIRMGTVSAASLSRKRPYVIVAAFVLAMILTPPDVVSQVLLAIPIWLLFEAGLFMAKVLKADAHASENGPEDTSGNLSN